MKNLIDKTLAEHLPSALIMLDAQEKILWWNKVAEKLFALHESQTLPELLPSLDSQTLLHHKSTVELTLKTQPKTYLSFSSISYPNRQTLVIVENITHIHHLERMRQDFVANVSHELRTPLTVIHGYLETVLDQAKDASTKDIFMQMQQQSHRMERLVEDLLLLSRLEIDVPDEEKFQLLDINSLLEKIINDAQALSGNNQHHIILEADKTLKILGLENELRSAFSNLIFNAVHYTPPEGKILIQWCRRQNQAYLSVTDSGIGIEPQHIHRITERFYRVDRDRSRKSGGTGLGLAIVKHALIRHHAQLKIESTFGQGSTFTCVFPL